MQNERQIMGYFLKTFFILLTFNQVSAAPTITSFDKTASIKEGTAANTDLSKIDCSDPDGDPTKTYVKSITPTSPCAGCFNVYSCGALECLQYRAGVGTLDRTQAASYLVTISCTDNNEAPAVEVIEIVVVPNAPPEFVPNALNITKSVSSSLAAGSLIYTVSAKDPDGDTVTYKMKVIPTSSSDHYAIDQYTGKITSTVSMKSECRNDVTLEVTASDGQHNVGPMVIDVPITNPNVAPVAANLDSLIQIPEDTGVGSSVFKMVMIDDNGDTVKYNVTSSNADGIAQFSLGSCITAACTAADVTVKKALDYENSPLRQTDATVMLTDGYCYSPAYSVRLQVTDVNEPPTINLTNPILQMCEGKQEFMPPYQVNDPDQYDTQKWSFDPPTSNSDPFGIDPNTGSIKTLVDYEVDSPGAMTNPVTLKIIMVDKGSKTASATVTASFLDCNDNAPVMQANTYTASSTDCAAPGTKLITIKATDKDSAREGNNVLYYEGSGGSVTVNDNGDVILNEPMPAGTVVTFNAYAYDRGLTPGPLRSVNPAVISVRFTPCPTTSPPAAATAAPTAAATAAATTKASSSKKSDDSLVWIILAALLGTLFLGLLAFMLWRYGARCLEAFRNISCEKQCCKPRPHRLLTPRVERRPPVSKAPDKPVEPEPEPAGPGFLFGFWKERYPDDDFKHMPDRKRLPTPGDMEAHYPHTLDPVEDPLTSQANAVAETPKKNCVVM